MFRAEMGNHVEAEPAAKLIGVKVAAGRYVQALSLITKQKQADALPQITEGYAYRKLNEGVVRVNVQLADVGQPQQIKR